MTGPLARYKPLVALGAAVAVLAAVIAVVIGVTGGGATRTIQARFVEAPGLYKGNSVDVVGIKVGTVTAVRPGPGYVTVTMAIDDSVKIPAGADAILMAPMVVSDRFVQLTPGYTSGPVMPAGAVIPLDRTTIPQSVDQVFSTLNNLAEQLGPNGVNKNGALTDLVHQMATTFGGSGSDFHSAVVNFSQALAGLSANSPALAGTLNNLGGLSKALGDSSDAYTSFADNLSAVSQVLANDSTDVSSVLSSLQQLFANLTTFIQQNGSHLGSSIDNLRTFAEALNKEQDALAQTYQLSPLALQNLDNAIDKNAPGGPAIRGRYDPVASTQTLFNQVCGSAALRFLVILASGTQTNPLTTATSTDTLCGIGNALNALTPPPGAAPGPDLSLQALVP